MVTVAELRRALAELDGESVVVLSADAEGNGYSALVSIESDLYFREPNTPLGRGEVYALEEFETGQAASERGESVSLAQTHEAVVFWPEG